MLSKRRALKQKEVLEKSLAIEKHFFLLKEVSEAKIFGVYADFDNEPSTRGIIKKLLSLGKKVCVPETDFENNTLSFCQISSLSELRETEHGIPEPEGQNPVAASEIGVFVVPGVAFDAKGHRLGFGAGFYDRFFSSTQVKGLRVASAFDFQLVENVPKEPHDARMHFIVTEKRIVKI